MNDPVGRDVRFLKIYVAFLTVTLVMMLAVVALGARDDDILEVQRIDVREPDGRLALVISNGTLIPGPRFDGSELSPEVSEGRQGSAGLVFYNARGDEVGGLIFRGDSLEAGRSAHAALAFDQYRQDQVVGIQYVEDGGSRSAGLHVWDRPADMTIGELFQLSQDAGGADAERSREARARLAALQEEGRLGAPRIFLGGRDGVAELVLRDSRGRPRIRLRVDTADTPLIELLDSAGTVVSRIPSAP